MRNVLLLLIVCSLVFISCQAAQPVEETPEEPIAEATSEATSPPEPGNTSGELPVVNEEDEPTATATSTQTPTPADTATPTPPPTNTAAPTVTPTAEPPGETDELADLIDCTTRELIVGTQVTTTDIVTGTFAIIGTDAVFNIWTAGVDILQEAAEASAVVQGGINIYNPAFPVPTDPNTPQVNETYLFVFIPALNQVTPQHVQFRDNLFQPVDPPQFQVTVEGVRLTFTVPAAQIPADGRWSAFTLWDTGTLQCDEIGYADNGPRLLLEWPQ